MFQLTSVSCPMCGLHKHTSAYHREMYPVNIRLIEKRGLGRGRGFEIISEESIFDYMDDPEYGNILATMADRAIETLNLLIENDVISEDEVREKLGFT